MDNTGVILCHDMKLELAESINLCAPDQLYVLTDETTHALCWPLLQDVKALAQAHHIIIRPGDVNKNLETLSDVWQALSEQGATRHSLLICLGGGMVTDLGGFAASTF